MNSKFKRFLACLLSLMMVVSLFPMSAITAFAAENDATSAISESESWYWDGNTLYVYQGKITKGELYNALVEKYGSGTYKYGTSKPTLSWILGGTEVKSGQTGNITLNGGTLFVGKKVSSWSWTDYSFTVQTYGFSANFPTLQTATVHMDGNVQAGEQHVTLKAAILAAVVTDWGDYAGITPTVYAYDDGTLSSGWHKLEWFIDSLLTSGIYPATASRPIKFEWPATGDLPAYTAEVGVVFSDHNRTSNPVVTAPTCTAGGYTTYTCDCGLFTCKGAETAALGHTWVDATFEAPKTCTTCGATEGEAKEAITIPENVTGDSAVIEEIKNNTALKGYTPVGLPAGAELKIELVSVGETIVFNVTTTAELTDETITFRLPIPESVTEKYVKISVSAMRASEEYVIYEVNGEGDAKYVEVVTNTLGRFTVEPIVSGLIGSGTEADPYQIGSLDDLILFRDSVNAGEGKYNDANVILTADIDLSSVENWIPIGNVAYNSKYAPADTTKVFSGVFDGNGKVISNLKMTKIMNGGADAEANLGLFGITGEGAVIKNLTITNVNIDTDGRNVGALVAFGYKATIDNITLNGNIQIKGGNNVSGVIAMTRHYAVSVTSITVKGEAGSAIVGNNIVGGIFAEIAPNGSAQTFKDLSVENVAITGVGGVGGIVGLMTTGTVENIAVKNVALTGKTEYQGNAMGRIRLGSVAGLMGGKFSTIANATVENVTAKNLDGNAVVLPIIGANYDASSNATEAKIGDKYYATFADALAKATDGETITLLAPVVIKAGETLEINKNITIEYTSNVINEAMFNNKGTLIIDKASIIYTYTGEGDTAFTKGNYTIRNEGTLVVNGGLIVNASAQAVHCNQAVFQYSGSTTINGGTVSTPAYRSARLWKGDMTINGGTFVGQVWVQAVDNSSKLTINGGEFAPAGGDASSVFVTNSTYNVAFAVTGGTFNGKIGCSDATKLAGAISGGLFTENAKMGTNAALLADNFVFKANGNGYYGIATPVASVNGVGYATLADAIANADAGATITLLADVNENVTIDKNLTIDGAGKNYTGTMTANAGLTVTVQNVNFVNGGFAKSTKSTTGNYTIKNCTFDGAGKYAYPFLFKGANKIVIEDCTVKDYMYSFLYVSSATSNVSVKDVTVENCPNYAVYFASGVNTATFENLIVKNSNNGFVLNNSANRAFTIKNCTMENVGTAISEANGTKTITCTVLGVNDFGGAALSQYANVIGVQGGTKIYETLADAFAAAQDGDTIKVLGNIAVSEGITNTKKITLDLNGKTITGTDNATGSFGLITNKGELTITGNGTMTLVATNNRGWNAYSSVISNTVGGKLIVENGTIEHLGGTDMAYGIDNLTNGKGTYAETIINGGTIKSPYRAIRQFLNGVEAQNILTINGGVVVGANKSVWMQDPSKNANTGKLTVGKNATLNGDVYLFVTEGSTEWPVEVSIAASAVKNDILTGNVPAKYMLEKVSGNWIVNEYVAKVSNGTTTKYYKTLQEALDKTPKYYTVTLFENYEGDELVVGKNNKSATDGITINLNGFELNADIKVNSPSSKFTLTLKNGTVNGDILATDNLTMSGVTVIGDITVTGGTCTIKEDAAVTGKIDVTGTGVLKITAGAMINRTAFGVAEAQNVSITAAAYVLNYQSKAVYGYYGDLDSAVAATAKYYTLVLMSNIEVENTINPTASITLNLNGKKLYGTVAAGESLILNTYGLTITGNGTIEATFDGNVDNGKAVNAIVNKSSLTVNSGNIALLGTGAQQIGYAIDNYGGATLTVKGGKITATNSSWFDAIRLFCSSKEIKVTVQGGEISSIWAQNPSANKASEVFGTVVVKDGTIGAIYYENYTTVQVLKALNVNVVANGAGAENATVKTNSAGYRVYAW